ncbi:hypothetical protein CANARDRAFT_197242 [[Candida] arabinofermentans NRRL YB-2248]|uniref:DNA ligase n=1 Tax=[Candida] arabinofermentans NRRL YB-2248 TaxID=983967 RepID=A0A1E4T420_9ASCO|nr:hypothetical protein CANARDRAFT_197242 [[Candida] arabinofermentans NRRL YB-2248]
MKLLLPSYDRERLYLLKESKLGICISKVFGLPKSGEAYKKITNWKRMTWNQIHSKTRFPDTLVSIISTRRVEPSAGQLTVQQINEFLDRLHSFSMGVNDSEEKETTTQADIIGQVIPLLSNRELKFLFCIILKVDPLPISSNRLIGAWNPDAVSLFDLINDLKVVFWALADKDTRLSVNDKQVRINYPFTPMRSTRINENYDIIANERLNNNLFIEEKYDGERIQLHMIRDGDNLKFKFFSRNAHDFSLIYGSSTDVDAEGCIGPFIKDCFHDAINNCVLDGEMICYDPLRKEALPYTTVRLSALNMLAKQGRGKKNNDEPHPLFMVFDILRYGITGSEYSLEDLPLSDRRKLLSKVVTKNSEYLEVAGYKHAKTGSEIQAALQLAIEKDSEGLIIKDPTSKYNVGESRGHSWIKIKPEYLLGFGENLDVVIVGMTAATKSTYICALRNNTTIDFNAKFVTLCAVANGFSSEDYKTIHELTRDKWHTWSDDCLPPTELIQFGKRIPEKWINPSDSVVIEIKARSIDLQSSGMKFATGTTLHGAYMYRLRGDKDCSTASTLAEYRMASNKGKWDTTHTVQKKGTKRARVTQREMAIHALNNGFQTFIDQSDNDSTDDDKVASSKKPIFSNYVFCIKTDCFYRGEWRKISYLSQVLKSHGAATVRNHQAIIPEGRSLMIIADKVTLDVNHISKNYNLFTFQWCEDCIDAGEIVKLRPGHILLGEKRLFEECKRNIDRFGDSITIELNPFTFKEILERNCDVLNWEEELELSTTSRSLHSDDESARVLDIYLFHDLKFLIVESSQGSETQKDILVSKIIGEGGAITNELDDCSICVISLDGNDGDLVKDMKKRIAARAGYNKKIPHFVSASFVDACIAKGMMLEPLDFQIPSN